MTIKHGAVLFVGLALLGQGCVTINAPTSPESPEAMEKTEGMTASCPVTPQVYYFNKLAFSPREIESIQTNVVAPLVEYYHGTGEAEVVSIMIKRTSTGISVEAIVDQNEVDEPVYHGFVHPRSGTDSYPTWYPEEVPPEYRG